MVYRAAAVKDFDGEDGISIGRSPKSAVCPPEKQELSAHEKADNICLLVGSEVFQSERDDPS